MCVESFSMPTLRYTIFAFWIVLLLLRNGDSLTVHSDSEWSVLLTLYRVHGDTAHIYVPVHSIPPTQHRQNHEWALSWHIHHALKITILSEKKFVWKKEIVFHWMYEAHASQRKLLHYMLLCMCHSNLYNWSINKSWYEIDEDITIFGWVLCNTNGL